MNSPIPRRYRNEYAALRVVGSLVRALPYRAALSLAWLLSFVAFHIFRFRKAEAIRRLERVFGTGLSRRKAGSVAREAARNITFTAIEMLRIPTMKAHWVDAVCDGKVTIDTLARHSSSGRGAIVACPHMGSWELAAVACRLHGIPVFTIAAAHRNELVDQYTRKLRESQGIDTIARGRQTMKEVIRRLRRGEILAILPDVRVRTEGINVPFLNGHANIGKGMALFARHTNVPIFPCIVTRLGWAHHRLTLHPAVFPDQTLAKEEDLQRMTTQVLQLMDVEIRKHPEQWFWFNKRWILDPL